MLLASKIEGIKGTASLMFDYTGTVIDVNIAKRYPLDVLKATAELENAKLRSYEEEGITHHYVVIKCQYCTIYINEEHVG